MKSQKYSLTQNVFVAQLENVKIFHSILKAINFKESATFRAMKEGLKITVEDSKCIQCSAYIPQNNFTLYHLNSQQSDDDNEVRFVLNLNILTECLNMFSVGEDYCSLKMYYKGQGAPLTLVLEQHSEDDVLIDCTIKTQESDELLDFTTVESSTQNFIIFKGTTLIQILGDANKECEIMEILLSPETPHMRLTFKGVQGESQVDIPNISDMIETFRCATAASSRYKFSHIKLITRAMNLTNKVSLRTDEEGILSLQIMVVTDNDTMYIQYFLTPLVDEE